jgi:uncharacterized protein
MMRRFVETILVTGLFGMLFTLLHVPLSWMLGPLTGVLVWTGAAKRTLACPVWLRNGGMLVLGYAMDLAFTAESARQITEQLPWMLLATLLTVGFSLVLGWLLSKWTGVDRATGMIGSIPGGLTQMVLLAEEIKGSDTTVVAFLQTIRLLTVIFVVPFLAVHALAGSATDVSPLISLHGTAAAAASERSAWVLLGLAALMLLSAHLAVRLRLPTPWFLGPMAAAAVITVAGWAPPALPAPMLLAAQWTLGAYLGLGIKLSSLAGWRRLLPLSLLSAMLIVGFSLVLSVCFSWIHPMSIATAFLSTSPGGMTEMGVTATLVQADVSLVVAYQMFRILFILFLVPYGLRRWLRAGSCKQLES